MKKEKTSSKIIKIFFIAISLIAGIHIMFYPEEVKMIVVRGIGLLWTFQGIRELLEYRIDRLKEKLNKEEDGIR